MSPDYIAPHILRSEYACRCCGRIPFDIDTPGHRELFESFAKIRETIGHSLPINSGFRCVQHNTAVHGEPLSVHLFGLALDIQAKDDAEVDELASVVNLRLPNLRLGVYHRAGTFIHIDTGYHIIPRVCREWHIGARWAE